MRPTWILGMVAAMLAGAASSAGTVAPKPHLGGPGTAETTSCTVVIPNPEHTNTCHFQCEANDPPYENHWIEIYVSSASPPVWGEIYGCGNQYICANPGTSCYWQGWTGGNSGEGSCILKVGNYAFCAGY